VKSTQVAMCTHSRGIEESVFAKVTAASEAVGEGGGGQDEQKRKKISAIRTYP